MLHFCFSKEHNFGEESHIQYLYDHSRLSCVLQHSSGRNYLNCRRDVLAACGALAFFRTITHVLQHRPSYTCRSATGSPGCFITANSASFHLYGNSHAAPTGTSYFYLTVPTAAVQVFSCDDQGTSVDYSRVYKSIFIRTRGMQRGLWFSWSWKEMLWWKHSKGYPKGHVSQHVNF